MPDTTLVDGYLETASLLARSNANEPTQASIRKSISCAYSAMFHALARMSADALVGEIIAGRSNKAWVEVYRGLAHGTCKDACSKAKNIEFPDCISKFANMFVQLQDARKRADYDPIARPTKENAIFCAVIAKIAIDALNEANDYDKTAFATWVLITTPGAKQAREIHRAGSKRGLEEIFQAVRP